MTKKRILGIVFIACGILALLLPHICEQIIKIGFIQTMINLTIAILITCVIIASVGFGAYLLFNE